ncbi:AAA family ATPase [Tenggerimyces flavus]|uniref:AAA family ATPase n=1 Tax=Tenggerimyces flavus TaxID=1708749 RepID=A0ABV7YJ45_9ACTN|nr:AAA family ATPase [Tenggerimyces flavus]MBM7784596.1 putative kinase [Tenggerimyces flavus]
MEQPKVVLVTGIMASGKSTVAQLLAERLPRSAHVRGDAFRRMIVNGGVDIVPEGGDAMDEELSLRYRIAAQVADEYVRAGFTAVVQDVVLGASVQEFVDLTTSRPVAVVVLTPRPEVVARREDERPKSGYVDWTVKELDDYLRAETPRIGLWLDTSDQTPDQTVDEILARMSEAIADAQGRP